jgi:DNA-binding GntR family transcriptional regulator
MRQHNVEHRRHGPAYLDDHRRIFHAIEARDPDRAMEAMRSHIERIQSDLDASDAPAIEPHDGDSFPGGRRPSRDATTGGQP